MKLSLVMRGIVVWLLSLVNLSTAFFRQLFRQPSFRDPPRVVLVIIADSILDSQRRLRRNSTGAASRSARVGRFRLVVEADMPWRNVSSGWIQ